MNFSHLNTFSSPMVHVQDAPLHHYGSGSLVHYTDLPSSAKERYRRQPTPVRIPVPMSFPQRAEFPGQAVTETFLCF
jgi:hypothetical protein